MRIRLVLAVGFTLTLAALLAVLWHSPLVVVSTNGVPEEGQLASLDANADLCQARETLPAGTSAIRVDLDPTIGPRVKLDVFAQATGATVTSGEAVAGWYGSSVTVPVSRVRSRVANVTVCVQLIGLTGTVLAVGALSSRAGAATHDGAKLPGRVGITYLRAGTRSWLSQALAVARHMGLGRAWSGTWIAVATGALMLAAFIAGSWVLMRELR